VDAKVAIYGGDDGCDFLPAPLVRQALEALGPGKDLVISLEGDDILFIVPDAS